MGNKNKAFLSNLPVSAEFSHVYGEYGKAAVRITIDTLKAVVADLAAQAQTSAEAAAASMAAIEAAMDSLTTTGEQAAAIAALKTSKADLSKVNSIQQKIEEHTFYIEQALVALTAFNQDMQEAATRVNYDHASLPLLCGQPMMLFGAGTPQEAIVPDNWQQFDPETGTGYNWNGEPSALGQVYINTTAETNGRYTAVRSGNTLIWKNF